MARIHKLNYFNRSKVRNMIPFLNAVRNNSFLQMLSISVSGKINFGISGKNVIEYKAFDPSGNTTILKRVITVE